MNKFTVVFSFFIAFAQASAWAQSSGINNVQAIQAAEISQLKQQIKLLTESLKETRSDLQRKVDGLSNDVAAAKAAIVVAQSAANTAANAASTAQATANNALNAAAAAQSTANTAYANTSNPVIMVGAGTGRQWPSCPPGYHWIGGFNNDTTVAYPELNRWHTNYAWLCARD
jgi:hypothetical protein